MYGPGMPRFLHGLLKWFGSGAIAISFIIACAASATFIVQQYNGDPLPAERIAILRMVGGEEGYLASLDGENLDYRVEGHSDRIHIEMLPGQHEVGVSLRQLGLVVYRVFEARAGVIYQFKVLRSVLQRGKRSRQTWSVGVFEVSPETGDLIRDVSRSPLPPAPPSLEPPPSLAPPPPTLGAGGAGGTPAMPESPAGGPGGSFGSAGAPPNAAPSSPATVGPTSSAPSAPHMAPTATASASTTAPPPGTTAQTSAPAATGAPSATVGPTAPGEASSP